MKEQIKYSIFSHHFTFLHNIFPPLKFYFYNFSQPRFQKYQKFTSKSVIKKIEYYFESYIISYIQKYCEITNDPYKADLFYIPVYFSSVMFLDDDNFLDELIEKLEYFSLHGGVDHIIVYNIFSHWRSGIKERHEYTLPCMLSFADFKWDISTKYPTLMHRYTILPYTSLNKFSTSFNKNRNNLLFFMGSTLLDTFEEDSGELRTEVLNKAKKIPSSRIYIKERMKHPEDLTHIFAIDKIMENSHFCIVPPGDSPSSKRIFDSFNALSIPVVVSDYIRFPFEDVFINYSQILIHISMDNFKKSPYLPFLHINMHTMKRMKKSISEIRQLLYLEKRNSQFNSIFWAWTMSQYIKACYISSSMRRSLLNSTF